MPTKRKRYTVNIPPELEELALARAKAEKRSVANYLEWLVENDVRANSNGRLRKLAQKAQGILLRADQRVEDVPRK